MPFFSVFLSLKWTKKPHLLYKCTHMNGSVHGCSLIRQVLHYSKYLLGLWIWHNLYLKPYSTLPWNTSPNSRKITRASLGKAEGKCELVERDESTTATAVSKSQQPRDVLCVIFYGWRGTQDVHLFISTVSTDLCVCMYVFVKKRCFIALFLCFCIKMAMVTFPSLGWY